MPSNNPLNLINGNGRIDGLFENGYWCQKHEQGTAMSQTTYNKHHRKTPEQLYNQFIESKKQ